MRRVRATALLAVVLLVVLPFGASASPRADQWGLDRIRAPEAWQVDRGGGVVVAVLDTGVHLTHPDLAPRLLRDRDGRVVGRDLVTGGDPHDEHGHGTLVAGIVAAAVDQGVGGPGIAGVAPEARLMPVRVLDHEGRGRISDVDAGIRWAVDHGADVVNLSLESAAPLPGDLLGGGLDAAVHYAWERGVVVVAAAGNSGTPFTDFRSSTPVLLVGATDRNDRRATFSDGGRSDMVMAPGVDVVSTACDRPCRAGGGAGYARADGTSFAAPHVAGAVAVLRASGRGPGEAVARLRSTAVPVPSGGLVTTGHGRIDLAAAVGAPAGAAGGAEATSRTAAPSDPSPSPTPAPERGADQPSPVTADGAADADDAGTPPARPPPRAPTSTPGAPDDEHEPAPERAPPPADDLPEETDGPSAEIATPPGTTALGPVVLPQPGAGHVARVRALAAVTLLVSGAAVVGVIRRHDRTGPTAPR
jgi:subtilisin family serine protease